MLTQERSSTVEIPPAGDPLIVTLDEAKLFIRYSGTELNGEITGFIKDAQKRIETITWQNLFTTTFDAYDGVLDLLPDVMLPAPPVQSVVEVAIQDDTFAEEIVDPDNYRVNIPATPSRITFLNSLCSYGLTTVSRVRVRFVSGYGVDAAAIAANAPDLKNYALQLIHNDFAEKLGGPIDESLPSVTHVEQRLLSLRIDDA